MKRNEYGACSSWWDPEGNGACAHCGVRKWRHDAPVEFDTGEGRYYVPFDLVPIPEDEIDAW